MISKTAKEVLENEVGTFGRSNRTPSTPVWLIQRGSVDCLWVAKTHNGTKSVRGNSKSYRSPRSTRQNPMNVALRLQSVGHRSPWNIIHSS